MSRRNAGKPPEWHAQNEVMGMVMGEKSFSHTIPAGQGVPPGRNRKGEMLFIDAGKLGTLIDRVLRELTGADLVDCMGA